MSYIKKGECWEWNKGRTSRGYGALYVKDNGVLKQKPAHRHYYEKHKGKIPDGLVLDHLCRNKICVNPEHLEAVTTAENVRRGKATKLSVEQVISIRSLWNSGKYRKYKIAEIFGISDRQVSKITLNRQWNV